MAVTALLSVQQSCVPSGQEVIFTVKLTNGGVSDVDITSAVVSRGTNVVGNVDSSIDFFPGGETTVVASGGILYGAFGGTFFANERPTDATTQETANSINVALYFDDGSVVTSNVVTVQAVPLTGGYTTPFADVGATRFDSNQNSAIFAVVL